MSAAGYRSAGKLDRPAWILELRETQPGVWTWERMRESWMFCELQNRRNLFSQTGVGARDAQLVLWRQDITLHNAIFSRGQHFFLTAITDRNRNQLDVTAALVEPVRCVAQPWHNEKGAGNRAERVNDPPVTFPGVLTEKYIRYQSEDSYAKSVGTYVLVTPKVIQLREGVLVTVQEGPAAAVYNVQVCHALDKYKNEYEIAFSRDI